jgi:methionine-R-sulfoxide reductase
MGDSPSDPFSDCTGEVRMGRTPVLAANKRLIAVSLLLGVVAVGVMLWPNAAPENKGKHVRVKIFNRLGELVGPIEMQRVVRTDAQWREVLTPAQFAIAPGKGTERAFCGTLLDNHRKGVYACVCCRLPLFTSANKFNSGTGWPSFFAPVAQENVVTATDRSHGMTRSEILCARCDCHLGHVFEDGPPPTGLRFCVNSESLVFVDDGALATLADPAAETMSQ